MAAQQFNIDNISNNLANVNTTGFKSQRVHFKDLYYQNLYAGGDQVISVGSGVRVGGTQRDFSQGPLEKCEDPLSLAIEGEGFFKVAGPGDQTYYTRDGSFRLDNQRRLMTASGYPVSIDGGNTIPRNIMDLSIDEEGLITGKIGDSYVEIGRIELAMFFNAAGLQAIGSNLYSETPQSGEAISVRPGEQGAGSLLPGYTEKSNVEIVSEMVNLIVAQRAFELNSKSVETADQMWAIANSIRR